MSRVASSPLAPLLALSAAAALASVAGALELAPELVARPAVAWLFFGGAALPLVARAGPQGASPTKLALFACLLSPVVVTALWSVLHLALDSGAALAVTFGALLPLQLVGLGRRARSERTGRAFALVVGIAGAAGPLHRGIAPARQRAARLVPRAPALERRLRRRRRRAAGEPLDGPARTSPTTGSGTAWVRCWPARWRSLRSRPWPCSTCGPRRRCRSRSTSVPRRSGAAREPPGAPWSRASRWPSSASTPWAATTRSRAAGSRATRRTTWSSWPCCGGGRTAGTRGSPSVLRSSATSRRTRPRSR